MPRQQRSGHQVVETRVTGETIRHEPYRDRTKAEQRAAERANELADNDPTEIQARRVRWTR